MDQLSALGRDLQLHILQHLDVSSVLSLGCCSREWYRLTACEQALWEGLCERDQAPLRRHVEQQRAAGACWRAAYRSALALQSLARLAWEAQPRPAGRRPREREGHAACAWGGASMLLSGGFGGGILSDLHLLTPAPGGAPGGYRWVQPRLIGQPPLPRYGHSLTRCGPGSDMAVLFGGLMAGGYQGALDTLAVLRRRQPGEAGGKCGGHEQQTSLALRAGRGGPGGPGPWFQVMYAQLLLEELQGWGASDDEADGGAEDSGDGASASDSGDYTDAPDTDDPESDGGSSDDDDGGEGAGGEEGSSGSADSQGAEWQAVAQVLQAGGSGEGSGGAAPAAGSHGAGGGAPAALPPAEEAWVAEGEYEWWYPAVSGEAPGARGYHSAAASEDGRKIYFFGGIAEHGACASLAVLDVETWTFSRPVTSGEAPTPRLGHSSCVFGGRLWVVGGGSGRDLLRSGRDLDDVYCLDLETMEWRRVAVAGTAPLCAGKCHASALVGRRLLLFAGSMHTCGEVAWLDLEQLSWGRPRAVAGPPPCERMSATAVLGGGGDVLVFGGYTFEYREVGDLYRLKLLPSEQELARLGEGAPSRGRGSAGRAAGRMGWRGFWR